MKKIATTETAIDWRVADAMTDDQRLAAAISDLNAVQWGEAPRVAQVKTVRRVPKLSQ
jgi:hypothetical protein